MSNKTDEELVELVINNDQEIYAQLVERYEAKLTRYARSIVYDPDAAADVVQNGFIKAFINLRGFNTKLQFSSWIYRITHNEAINVIRKNSKELRPDDESWFDTIADERDGAAEELDKEFLAKEMATALATLEVKYREPIVLHIYQGKSYKEIGDILKLPVATVGTRIARAKGQLKKIIEEKGDQR